MALWDTPFDEIDATRLQALADQDVLEDLRLEYKSGLDVATPEGKRKFLKAMAAFANSAGGDLIIGMKTRDGHPTGLVSATTAPDQEKLRLESSVLDNIEPRLHGLRIKEVALPVGGYVLLVRIPQSLDPPHRVTFGSMNRFYGRSSAGTHELGIEELRRLFGLAPRLAQLVRDFRAARLTKIAAGETPVMLAPGMRTVIHIVPLALFPTGRNRAFVSEAAQRWLEFLPPHPQKDSSHAFNLDGMVTYHHYGPSEPGRLGYAHVFSSGAIECVIVEESGSLHPAQYVLGLAETEIATAVAHFGRALKRCNVAGPYAVLVSLLGAKGITTATSSAYTLSGRLRSFDREQVHCEEVVLDDIPESTALCAAALRDLLDHLANAAGFEKSPHFSPDGTWQLRERR